jgi:hypothetical protein
MTERRLLVLAEAPRLVGVGRRRLADRVGAAGVAPAAGGVRLANA